MSNKQKITLNRVDTRPNKSLRSIFIYLFISIHCRYIYIIYYNYNTTTTHIFCLLQHVKRLTSLHILTRKN